MKFLIQCQEESGMEMEFQIVMNKIKESKFVNEISSICSLKDMPDKTSDCIPIGSLEFVDKWLSLNFPNKFQTPIEVPEFLKNNHFLKRDYKYVSYDEFPLQGNYFVKDVSKLKRFSYAGNVKYLDKNVLDITHTYLLSEFVNILSEYRVYVIDGKIENICNYNGDCTVLLDLNLIKEAVFLMNLNESMPDSYTIDVMVTDRGTSIIEIHNFVAVGLYSTLWGQNLLYAYRDGINYLIK